MKNLYTFLIILVISVSVFAQEPSGYYNSAENKTSAALKTALYGIVSSHTALSYDALWTAFKTTDKRADGKVWDIYSNITNYTFGTNQCGSYGSEGDCYNREHSFPKSWFNDATPMYTDLFHLYPSDGKVNGMRSNYPFGEVGTVTYQSANGYSKLGKCNFPGYSETVFEPADELKGDLARTYFYMVTAYEDKVSGWNSEHLNGTKYPALNSWSIALLLKWHRQDPVSQKEINRNNSIYNDFQHNRNPFIDHPELAEYIWGNKMGTDWTLNGSGEPTLSSPTNGSTVDFGTVTYNQNNTQTISVLGSSLTGDLTLTLSGTNAAYFSIPVSTISKTNAQAGYNLVITYNAPETGTHNAVLTISGGGISNVTVNLAGNAVSCQNLNFSAPFSTTMSPFTQYSVSGDQVWTWKSAAYGVAMSGYVNPNNNANEDWLISPAIDLSTYEGVVLAFEHTINYGTVANMQSENTVWISNNYTSGNPNTASWTQVIIPTYPAGNDWVFVNSGNIQIPADKCLANTIIGFKYISTTSASSTWEIKNLSITGNCKSTAVSNVNKEFHHKVFSASKNIIISNLENEDVLIYDIYGRKVFSQKNNFGEIPINDVLPGFYIVKAGNEVQKIIVK